MRESEGRQIMTNERVLMKSCRVSRTEQIKVRDMIKVETKDMERNLKEVICVLRRLGDQKKKRSNE